MNRADIDLRAEMDERRLGLIRGRALVASHGEDIKGLIRAVDQVPLWLPGRVIKTECELVSQLLGDLQSRIDHKLVVTILGPCGAGKSTLLNALAGEDGLSSTGIERPTTRRVTAYGQGLADTGFPGHRIDNLQLVTSRAADALGHVIIVDTPDMDSIDGQAHIPVIREVIGFSDVLLCLFSAENPKTRDNVDFLAPYVRRFGGEAVIAVLNKCDRLDRQELTGTILPEFSSYIQEAWQRPVSKILCVSARRNLHSPDWDPGAGPRHDLDQFQELRQLIFGTMNHFGYVIDRRLENATALRNYVSRELAAEKRKDKAFLEDALGRFQEAENQAVREAGQSIMAADALSLQGLNLMLYQKLASQWTGPVGWLIALWARILFFGAGMLALLRFGRPVSQVMGLVSSAMSYKANRNLLADTAREDLIQAAMQTYQARLLRAWPEIAGLLVKARFSPDVRTVKMNETEPPELAGELGRIWRAALNAEVDRTARHLSRLGLQVLFNLPVYILLGHVGYMTLSRYFNAQYLEPGFFVHAFLTIGLTLVFVFFILQLLVKVLGSASGIVSRAMTDVGARLQTFEIASRDPIKRQIVQVLDLSLPDMD